MNSQPKYKLLKQIWDRPGKSSFGELTAKVQTDAEGRAGPQFYRCQKLGQVKLARVFVYKQDAKCRSGDRTWREAAKWIWRGPGQSGVQFPCRRILLANSLLFASQNQLPEILESLR